MGCSASTSNQVEVTSVDDGAVQANAWTSGGSLELVGDASPGGFRLKVQKLNGDLVGVSLGNTNTGAVIFNVHPGGLLDKWNQNNPRRKLRQGYIIEQVNNATGYWNILEELRKTGMLVMTIATEPPPHAGPNWFEEVADIARDMEQQANKGPFMLRLQPKDRSESNKSRFSALPGVVAGECGVDQCAICLEDVSANETLVQLPCKHAFHSLCTVRWLAEKLGAKGQCCPLCCQKVVSVPGGGIALQDPAEAK